MFYRIHKLFLFYNLVSIFLCFTTNGEEGNLRMELLQLMKQDKGEMLWPALENIHKTVVADPITQKLVTLEIQVRRLSGLQYGESCDPSRQLNLDNPPETNTLEAIISWQETLLPSPRIPFCNWRAYMYCSPETWMCACRPGLIISETGQECLVPVGSNCGSDIYFQKLYFDPFLNIKSLVALDPPLCDRGLTCCHRQLFFAKKCWCKNSTCNDSPIFPKKSDFLQLKRNIQNLFSLEYGEACDPEFQHPILNPTELLDTQARVNYLRNVLTFPLRLCNISNHLNCSAESRVCQCWRSSDGRKLIYNPKLQTCIAPRSLHCGNTSLEFHFYDSDGPTVWNLQNVFMPEKNLRVQCAERTECRSNSISNSIGGVGVQHCACSGHFFGEDCLSPGSNFTGALHRPKVFLPSICITDIDRLYDQVNDKMSTLEHRLCLGFKSPCDINQERKMDSIDAFWKNFSSYWGIGENLKNVETWNTLQLLQNVKKSAEDLLLEVPGIKFCDRKLGYCCGEKSGECVCPKGTTLQNSKCRILAGHECDLLRGPFSLLCVKYAKCMNTTGSDHRLKGICKCRGDTTDSIGNGRSICEKSPVVDTKNSTPPHDYDRDGITPVPAKSRPTDRSIHEALPVTSGQKLSSTPGQIRIPQSKTPTIKHGKHIHVNDVHEHLIEMGTHRIAEHGEQCFIRDNEKFREIAQQFSDANKFHHNVSDHGPTEMLHVLTYLLAKGSHFCNIQKHFICSRLSSTCQCLQGLLLTSNQECRIPEGKECVNDPHDLEDRDIVDDFIIPSPKCGQRLICTLNSTTGNAVCVRDDKIGLEPRSGLKSDAVAAYPFLNFNLLVAFGVKSVAGR